jgi:Ca2+-binding RTX toxin-like protein
MIVYIFENMTADDAANFTAGDQLTFSTPYLQPLSVTVSNSNNSLDLTSLTVGSKTLTFDGAALAGASIHFTNPLPGTSDTSLFLGTSGNDSVTVTNDSIYNVAHGFAGADLITDGNGADSLFGGTGNDTILGNGGDDHLYGGSQGSFGEDDGADSLDGGAGSDALNGGSGDDTLRGGTGDDYLGGGPGNDHMFGGPGNDTYDVQDAGDVIIENPGEGTDLVYTSISFSIANFPNVENLTFTNDGGATLTGNSGDNHIRGAGAGGNDSISGGGGNDSLEGLDGADTLNGDDGDDTLDGGNGNDTLNGGDGNDLFKASAGTDVYNGGNGTDTLLAGGNLSGSQFQSIERIEFAPVPFSRITMTFDQVTDLLGTTTFVGTAGNDGLIILAEGAGTYQFPAMSFQNLTANGTAGDYLALLGSQPVDYVLKGSDALPYFQLLTGNFGNDLLIGTSRADGLDGSWGNDTLDGGGGDDTMSGDTGNDVYMVDSPGDVIHEVTYGTGYPDPDTDTVIASINYTLGSDLENLTLAEGSQAVSGTGNAKSNVITGNSSANTIDGGDGHDVIYGGDGADALIGGNGNDHLYGQSANGGPDGADSISGGSGSDYLQGNAGNDTLDGGDGSDRINGGANDDLITGGAGNDTVNGNLGNDTIDGGDGNNSLRGGQGNDSIVAGNGNDVISGDLGSDTLTGGGGTDIFVFSGQSSPVASPDRITDYTVGTDHLSLGFAPAAVLTGAAQASLSDAASAAQALFDGHAGNQEVAVLAVGSDSYVFYSSSGGATVDSAILLSGVSAGAISSSDFY